MGQEQKGEREERKRMRNVKERPVSSGIKAEKTKKSKK